MGALINKSRCAQCGRPIPSGQLCANRDCARDARWRLREKTYSCDTRESLLILLGQSGIEVLGSSERLTGLRQHKAELSRLVARCPHDKVPDTVIAQVTEWRGAVCCITRDEMLHGLGGILDAGWGIARDDDGLPPLDKNRGDLQAADLLATIKWLNDLPSSAEFHKGSGRGSRGALCLSHPVASGLPMNGSVWAWLAALPLPKEDDSGRWGAIGHQCATNGRRMDVHYWWLDRRNGRCNVSTSTIVSGAERSIRVSVMANADASAIADTAHWERCGLNLTSRRTGYAQDTWCQRFALHQGHETSISSFGCSAEPEVL